MTHAPSPPLVRRGLASGKMRPSRSSTTYPERPPVSARLVLDPDRLKRLRLERGLSQVDLWQASGVHHVTIARIETGNAKASLRTIRRLADALDLSILDLATVQETALA